MYVSWVIFLLFSGTENSLLDWREPLRPSPPRQRSQRNAFDIMQDYKKTLSQGKLAFNWVLNHIIRDQTSIFKIQYQKISKSTFFSKTEQICIADCKATSSSTSLQQAKNLQISLINHHFLRIEEWNPVHVETCAGLGWRLINIK